MLRNSFPSNTRPWPVVNRAAATVSVDLRPFCSVNLRAAQAPIDIYFADAAAVLALTQQDVVTSTPLLLRHLVIEVISIAEYYFRGVIAGLVAICPAARAEAATRVLTLNAVDYYGADYVLGVLEGVSLASAGEIGKQTRGVLGFEVPKGSPLQGAVFQFERICHLRHAIAHNSGHLGPRNLAELGVDAEFPCVVAVNAIGLQAIVAATHSMVRAYNTFLFESTANRWIERGVITGKWSKDRHRFQKLLRLFHSKADVAVLDARDSYDQMIGVLRAQGRLVIR